MIGNSIKQFPFKSVSLNDSFQWGISTCRAIDHRRKVKKCNNKKSVLYQYVQSL